MATEELIKATVFCTYHGIDYSFIMMLEESGLLELDIIEEEKFISHSQLQLLEQMTRLHQDLDINIAGIDAIINLLQRMQQMRQEIESMKNKLHFYE